MSTKQVGLDDDRFGTDDEADYECPLCGQSIQKINLSYHISTDECDPQYKEVRYDD